MIIGLIWHHLTVSAAWKRRSRCEMWVPIKYMTWLGKMQKELWKLTSSFFFCKTALLSFMLMSSTLMRENRPTLWASACMRVVTMVPHNPCKQDPISTNIVKLLAAYGTHARTAISQLYSHAKFDCNRLHSSTRSQTLLCQIPAVVIHQSPLVANVQTNKSN